MSQEIRLGVVGAWRGASFAAAAEHAGMKLVALCDTWEARLQQVGERYPGVALYRDYGDFLNHDMDAVALANFFHEHAPFAAQALRAGKHVLSEVIACSTLAEGVALVRAVEESQRIYMMAENYCYFSWNQEMRRLYQQGEIGEVQFAECEYNHACSAKELNQLAPGLTHWRNWLPATYYPTHALGPIMYITETRPVSVNAQAIARSLEDKETGHVRRGDPGSCLLVRMDNGALVHVFGLGLRGMSIWYRLHGTRGLMESLRRHGQEHYLRIVHEPWDMKEGDERERIYPPDFPVHAEQARRTGHAGGDFFTSSFFAEAIRSGVQPWLNVYRALDMSVVAMQAWRSCLDDGRPYEIPDFRSEAAREKYVEDNWTPFPGKARKPSDQAPPSIKGYNDPTGEQIAAARADWAEMGYTGD